MNKVLFAVGLLSAGMALGQTTGTTSTTTSTSNYNTSNTNNENSRNATMGTNSSTNRPSSMTGNSGGRRGGMNSGTRSMSGTSGTGSMSSTPGTSYNSTNSDNSGMNTGMSTGSYSSSSTSGSYNSNSTSGYGSSATTPSTNGSYNSNSTGTTGTSTTTPSTNGSYNNSTGTGTSTSGSYNTNSIGNGTSATTPSTTTDYNSTNNGTTVTTNSTYSTSNSMRPERTKDYKNFAYGIYVGANTTKFQGESFDANGSATGLTGRLGYQAGFFVRGGGRLYGQLGAEYFASSSNYFTTTGSGQSATSIRDQIDIKYIQVPVYLGYKLTESDRGISAVRVQVGVEYANQIGSTANQFGNLSDFKLKSGTFNGLGQLGFDAGPLFLDLTYHYGFSNAIQQNTGFAGSQRRILSASLGFKF